MSPGITIAIISASTAIFGSALTFYLSKRHEIKTEWRKRKLERYSSLLAAISNTVSSHVSNDEITEFALQFNTISLFCSTEVLDELNRFHAIASSDRIRDADWKKIHDEQFAKLLIAMRKDIGLDPKESVHTFQPMLMAKMK